MEISTLKLILACISTVMGASLPMLIYAIVAGKAYGRLKAEHEQSIIDILGNTSDIDKLGAKVDANKEQAFDEFVHKNDCDAINKNWKTYTDSLVSHRDIFNEQNSRDHETIGESLRAFIDDSKEERKLANMKLDKISECLHKMQNKKDC